jgi:hypothetical protein
MNIYNVFCAFFYQTLTKIGSKEPIFFTYFMATFLIISNILICINFYTYFFTTNFLPLNTVIIILIFILNGFIFTKANYKTVFLTKNQYIIIVSYILFSLISVLALSKLHHDRNIITKQNQK